MRFPSRSKVEELRKKYPAGTKLVLVCMDDAQAPPEGTTGTVNGVDDIGDIMVSWENGSSLKIVPDIDDFKVLGKGD